MNKVNIAVVDSGYNAKINIPYIKGWSYRKFNSQILKQTSFHDKNGHGTSCIATIMKECDSAQIYAIKILDRNLKCSADILLKSLVDLKNYDVKIINLSIAFEQDLISIRKICDELASQGKIIVASLKNSCQYSYPAVYNSVIGVGKNYYNDNCFIRGSIVNVLANTDGAFFRINDEKTYIINGTSYATALVSARIAKIINNTGIVERNRLLELLFRDVGVQPQKLQYSPDSKLIKCVVEIFVKIFNLNSNQQMCLKKLPLIDVIGYQLFTSIELILNDIERNFRLRKSYFIYKKDLETLNDFCRLIEKNKK